MNTYVYIRVHTSKQIITFCGITNLVCYTYFHWFFSPECQYIFGKQTGYIFQSPKNDNMDDKKLRFTESKS